MKRMLGTAVLFILLILTVVALTKIGGFRQNSASLQNNASAVE